MIFLIIISNCVVDATVFSWHQLRAERNLVALDIGYDLMSRLTRLNVFTNKSVDHVVFFFNYNSKHHQQVT